MHSSQRTCAAARSRLREVRRSRRRGREDPVTVPLSRLPAVRGSTPPATEIANRALQVETQRRRDLRDCLPTRSAGRALRTKPTGRSRCCRRATSCCGRDGSRCRREPRPSAYAGRSTMCASVPSASSFEGRNHERGTAANGVKQQVAAPVEETLLYLTLFSRRTRFPRFGRSAQREGQTGESAVAKPGNFVPGGRRRPTGQPYVHCARLRRTRAPAVGGPPWGVRAFERRLPVAPGPAVSVVVLVTQRKADRRPPKPSKRLDISDCVAAGAALEL